MAERPSVVELHDDNEITAMLERDRRWAAYALCDLEPRHRPYARYVGLRRDQQVAALVLVYAPPTFTSLVPCGDATDLVALLAEAPDLPQETVLLVREANLPAIEMRYAVSQRQALFRMVVTADELRLPSDVRADVVPLSAADLPALHRLYVSWPETVFSPSMLDGGVYFGAFRAGALVAAAGTHAVSPRHRIAVIGNVFTDPAHRGGGLATAVTGAVARALFDQGMSEVALNVREDNPAAVAIYRRLGFVMHERFWEGKGRLRA